MARVEEIQGLLSGLLKSHLRSTWPRARARPSVAVSQI